MKETDGHGDDNLSIREELKAMNEELTAINEELQSEIRNHQQTLEQLTEKQQFLDNILTNAPLVIWSIDLEGNFTYTQYKDGPGDPAGRIGKSAFDLYKGTEAETFVRRVLAGETTHEIVRMNGVHYGTRVSPILDKKGNKTGYLGVSFDISDRIRSERELQRFRQILDQAPGGVFIMDKDFNFEYLNPYFEKLSGFPVEELLHKNIRDTLYKNLSETPESRKEAIARLLEGKSWQGELRTINKDGSFYWANTIASPFTNDKGDIDGYFVIQQDVTEKKNMELALGEQEKLYRSLIEKSLDGIVISQDGKVVLVNKAFADMIGYTVEECLEKFGPQSIAPEDRERVVGIHYRRMKGELGDLRYTASILCKDGSKITAEFNTTTIEINGRNASLVSIRDVTEQLRMQKALERSERKYKTLVENSLEGITIVRDNRFRFANDTYCRMLGYSCEELYTMPAIETIHPGDRHKAGLIAERRKNKDFSTITEVLRMLTKSGEVIECETSSTLIEFDGEWASFFTSRDITETKKMQDAVSKSEQKYRELAEMLPQTVYELDARGDIIFFNQTGFKQFGLDNSDIGKSSFNFIHPSQHELMRENMKKTISERTNSFGNKYIAVRKNGETFPAMTFAAPIIDDEKVVGIRGLILDISEHEAMEKALRESEKKYRTLIEKATDGILITQAGVFKFVNKAFCEMMQYSEQELLDMPFINVVDPVHHQEMLDNHKRRMSGESFPAIYRAKLFRKDGSSIMVELNSRTTDFDGLPASFVITRDITDRLQTEEELLKAKAELEALNKNLEVRVQESTLKLTEANTQLIRLQKENLQSQFEVLRQQVNPHFLFNSLNVLTSLIKLEPDLAEKFTEHLSKVYRYVLENKDNDLVKLETELEFLDAYIFLLNIRFMDKIDVKITVDDNKKDLLVLPLALQLLIENAIKHNSMSKRNPLKIEISIENGNILKVENNLQERESHMASTGVGLRNIAHRYKLLEMPEPEFVKTETHFIARVPLKH